MCRVYQEFRLNIGKSSEFRFTFDPLFRPFCWVAISYSTLPLCQVKLILKHSSISVDSVTSILPSTETFHPRQYLGRKMSSTRVSPTIEAYCRWAQGSAFMALLPRSLFSKFRVYSMQARVKFLAAHPKVK